MAAKSMEEIAELLRRVKFRHKLFGGVDEDDVWRMMEKLHQEYAAVIDAQAERNNALLDERDQYIAWLEGQQNAAGGHQAGGAHG